MDSLISNLKYEELMSKVLSVDLNRSDILKTVGCGLIGFGLFYLGKLWYSYRFFKKRGIPTPEYEFFYGNFRQLRKELSYSQTLRNWTRTLGKTYGYYEGHLPVLVTSDLDLIQEIFIKQFNNFTARKKGPIARKYEENHGNLFLSSGSRWKRMRNIMNPTFSSSKMRELSPLIYSCSERLLDVLGKKDKEEIIVFDYLKRFTMDTIWNCAFGVDIDLQNNIDNEYFYKCEKVFQDNTNLNFYLKFGILFHEFKDTFFTFLFFFNQMFFIFGKTKNVIPIIWLKNQVVDIFETRKREKIYRKDYMQLLIDAECDDTSKIINNDKKDYKTNAIDKKMEKSEIIMNISLFMLAGYETTSNALNYSSYVLATHPEEQRKLIDEITNFYNDPENANPDSDNVNKLEYLDLFVKEVLRLYPIANSVVARRCTNPTTIKGIKFETDLVVAVDVLSVHLDPELWGPVDPNEFYPLRFSPEIKRNPLAFMAFGLGPRNCIGMKFALIELKLALVKILSRFEIHPSPNTPKSLDYVETFIRYPKQPITVIFRERD